MSAIKDVFVFLALAIFRFVKNRSWEIAQLRAIRIYLQIAEGTRRIALTIVLIQAFLMLCFLALVAAVLGIMLLIPIGLHTKAILLLTGGCIFFLISSFSVSILLSGRVWMKIFRADELVRRFGKT